MQNLNILTIFKLNSIVIKEIYRLEKQPITVDNASEPLSKPQ
jgi:hypothetical protein